MNIFVLDPDPAVAASYHCDQHLHKMILESAQMLSTAMYSWWPDSRPFIYKPAYINHPCTQWVCANKSNAVWLTYLMQALDEIRMNQESDQHAASKIKSLFWTWHNENVTDPDPFIFTGDPTIQILGGTVPEKYKYYYRSKHRAWVLDKGRGMTYKGRPVPDFMKDLIQ